jgi:hypothetical protein
MRTSETKTDTASEPSPREDRGYVPSLHPLPDLPLAMEAFHRLVNGPQDRKRIPVEKGRRLRLLLSYAPGQSKLAASRDWSSRFCFKGRRKGRVQGRWELDGSTGMGKVVGTRRASTVPAQH